MSFEDKVYKVLNKVITEEGTLWSEIVAAVEKANIKVDNWLDVRGVLQWMVDERIIERTNSVYVEKYVKCS